MAKLGFAVQLPYKINLAGTFTARDGHIAPRRYTDYDEEVRGDKDGDPPYTWIAPYGTHRLANHYMLNLRLERGFKIGFTMFIFSIDAFNVFNTNTTLDEEYNAWRQNFREKIMITSPRIFRFGVRLDF
jgi:hypothetical protein